MSLFKTERPSRGIEKAIRSMQEIDVKIAKMGINIPVELRTRLKMNAARNNISYTDIVISLIERYLETEE